MRHFSITQPLLPVGAFYWKIPKHTSGMFNSRHFKFAIFWYTAVGLKGKW